MKGMLNQKIGILGGGQLGKMLYQAATPLNLDIHFMDQSVEFPVGRICPHFTVGDFKNYEDVIRFGADKDVISIEIEAINAEALADLETQGKHIYPQPHIIKTIQDKGLQKDFFTSNSFKTSAYSLVPDSTSIKNKIAAKQINYPFVQKLRKDGYDGKGVQIISTESDQQHLFDAPSVIEDLIDLKAEIAVIVARSSSGEFAIYDPVDMVFDHKANLLDYQLAPASLSDEKIKEAKFLAKAVSQQLGIVGLLAVEMFIDHQDQLWINELAPRPHNSGHHTIEACVTSQYEQHLRCILGLPLGSTALTSQSLLMNLLGADHHVGPAHYESLDNCMALEGVHIHLYGKEQTKPYRKMGHVNIVDPDLASAKYKYQYIKKHLKIVSHG